MSCLPCGLDPLRQAFTNHHLDLIAQPNRIIVKNSANLTGVKIREIIESAGVCSAVSLYHQGRDFAFTISPTLLDFFSLTRHTQAVTEKIALMHLQPQGQYFALEELSQILKPSSFVGGSENSIQDRWFSSNRFRRFVSPALNKALFKLLSSYLKDGRPIIEIGSGIGYSLREPLSSSTIRTQLNSSECQLLSRTTSSPIYQMNIEKLYDALIQLGKKISLFFALNVFDTMDPKERAKNLLKLSLLQNPGDKILIILDTNPSLEYMISWLQALNPGYTVLPYAPLTSNDPQPLSIMLVPERMSLQPSIDTFIRLAIEMANALATGKPTQLQEDLHRLQEQLNLPVISLEDFFAEQVEIELAVLGYTSRSFYRAFFTKADPPTSPTPPKQHLLYKPVTDTLCTVCECAFNNELLLRALGKKDIHLPEKYTESYLQKLREENKLILGAEILVIEATKN